MLKINFGEYKKLGFIRKEKFSSHTYSQKIEKNTQEITLDDGSSQNAATIRLVYNFGFPVTEAFLNTLLPDTAIWNAERISDHLDNIVDGAFGGLQTSFRNFHFGKSMRHWFKGIEGFGPCLAFNAECISDSPIGTALIEKLSGLCLVMDGKKLRMTPQGVGYYHGPKGKIKKDRRSSSDVFPFEDPLAAPAHDVFSKELNIDFKFALAFEEGDGISAKIPLRDFYYGRHPLLSVSFNLHLQLPKAGETPLDNWIAIESKITDEINPFIDFLQSCTKLKNITDPHKTKGFSGWTQTDPVILRRKTPSHPLFLSRMVNAGGTIEGPVSGLHKATVIYPKPDIEVKSSDTFKVDSHGKKGIDFSRLPDSFFGGDSEDDSESPAALAEDTKTCSMGMGSSD